MIMADRSNVDPALVGAAVVFEMPGEPDDAALATASTLERTESCASAIGEARDTSAGAAVIKKPLSSYCLTAVASLFD